MGRDIFGSCELSSSSLAEVQLLRTTLVKRREQTQRENTRAGDFKIELPRITKLFSLSLSRGYLEFPPRNFSPSRCCRGELQPPPRRFPLSSNAFAVARARAPLCEISSGELRAEILRREVVRQKRGRERERN